MKVCVLDLVTLIGISLGGCLAVRAAAGEPRVVRVIAGDVLTDFLACNLRQLPAAARRVIRTLLRLRAGRPVDAMVRWRMRRDLLTAWGISQGQHVLGVATPHAYLAGCARYRTAEVSPRVRADRAPAARTRGPRRVHLITPGPPAPLAGPWRDVRWVQR